MKSCTYVFMPRLLRQHLDNRMVRYRLTKFCNLFCFPRLLTYLIAYSGIRSSQDSGLVSQGSLAISAKQKIMYLLRTRSLLYVKVTQH